YLTAAGGTIALPSGDSLDQQLVGGDQQISMDTIGRWPAKISLDPSGGLTVASGLVPGTYQLKYRRCGAGMSATCDTLQKAVVIAPFVKGGADTLLVPSTGTISQLTQNDQINGAPAVVGGNATVAVLGNWPPGIRLNSRGKMVVKAGIPPGVHYLRYLLCDTLPTPTCDTVSVKLKCLDSSLTFADVPDKPLRPSGPEDTVKDAPSLSLVKVFFWNDSPGPRNRQPQTSTSYREAYGILQDSIPKVVHLEGDLKVSDLKREVRSGWLELRQVVEEVKATLKRGETVKLTLTGFASKRGPAVYNKALSGRRIRSLENHILEELGELSTPSRARLNVKRVIRGEKEGGIEPSLNDRLSSVYSVQSALQRFVEVRVSY
ncbi:MAG: hypothetical protein RI565_09935, partial [Schleiferiaceae bacterium]|nr:hypothetical protein [Schleiferiaceae bacterium]